MYHCYIYIFFKFTDAHTQHIEHVWKEVRGNIPRYGTREGQLLGYLSEFLFERAYKQLKQIEMFFSYYCRDIFFYIQ